ncbi:hypothetical protein BN59_03087 [Legionella massiliensis]|uniref:Uncharacterized protein n=1 Tax=Legionella massiliensis TaxID=1034943 RepID=A0A078L4A6_9GAMM|nr:hypothetical protein [Legionella massiliensis]CDZ78773.1 hypothetical protein BN59_03087 [Legionella massiliensis]CEE14511.1 hypothetical protein BN1094_03087 [Legionella massiliensis]
MADPLNKDSVAECLNAINSLVSNEIKYYLLLILKAISKENTEKNRLIAAEIIQLCNVLSEFLDPEIQDHDHLTLIQSHYQNLSELSGAYTVAVEVGYALINLGSALLGFITGVLGALIGGVAGLFRAICTLNNPFYFLADGLVTGMSVGGAIGFRAPKKLFKDELTRQLRYALNGVSECMDKMTAQINLPFSYFEDKVRQEILVNNFNNDKQAFERFLEDETSFKVVTRSAQFLSENLEGYLGHHAQIIIDLPNQITPTLIEFAPESDEIDTRPFSQVEEPERRVSGQKLVEMIAFHQLLWQTEECDIGYVLTKMKGGENDCFSYVNKVLIGTNQDATSLRRFDDTENWVGRNIVGFFVQRLSPFSQEVFDTPNIGCDCS